MKISTEDLFLTVLSYYFGGDNLNKVSLIISDMKAFKDTVYIKKLASKTPFRPDAILYGEAGFLLSCERDVEGCELPVILNRAMQEVKDMIRRPNQRTLDLIAIHVSEGMSWMEKSYEEGQRLLRERGGEDDSASFLPPEFSADDETGTEQET